MSFTYNNAAPAQGPQTPSRSIPARQQSSNAPPMASTAPTGASQQSKRYRRPWKQQDSAIWLRPNEPWILVDPTTGAHYYNAAAGAFNSFPFMPVQYNPGPPLAGPSTQDFGPPPPPTSSAGQPQTPTFQTQPAGNPSIPTHAPSYPPPFAVTSVQNMPFIALESRAIGIIVWRYLSEFKGASAVGEMLVRKIVMKGVEEDKVNFEDMVRRGVRDEEWWTWADRMIGRTIVGGGEKEER